MATIKIPISYTYRQYPLSPEATKYSKKLAERKAKKAGFYYAIGGISLMSFLCLLLMEVYPEASSNIVLLGMALGIWAGLDLNRMINRWYEMRIQAALKNIDPGALSELLRHNEANGN